jgi:hypothetical protein
VEEGPADDTIADENVRRHLRKTRRLSKYDEDDREERRRRRESRRADGMKSSEGSQGDVRRSSRRDSGFITASREPSAQGGLFSRFRRIAGV